MLFTSVPAFRTNRSASLRQCDVCQSQVIHAPATANTQGKQWMLVHQHTCVCTRRQVRQAAKSPRTDKHSCVDKSKQMQPQMSILETVR